MEENVEENLPEPAAPTADNAAPPSAAPKTGKKSPGKWFRKIPREVLFSPGGIILLFYAAIMELIDLIPGFGLDTLTWEMALEIIFMVLLVFIAKTPIQSMLAPFVIERVPGISDILPSWILKLIM